MTDTAKKQSPEAKALAYANDTLGVHKIFEECEAQTATLDSVLTELSDLRDKVRECETEVEGRTLELAIAERAKHPDMSQAQMDKHVKEVAHKDAILTEAKSKLRQLRSDIDGLECDKQIAETKIKIATARMIELGGLLQYLAIIKLRQPPKGGSNGSVSSPIPGW